MSSDIAQIGFEVRTEELRKGAQAVDDFGAAGKRADSSTQLLKSSMAGLAKAAVGLAAGFASLNTLGTAITQARAFNAAVAETSTLIQGSREEIDLLERSAMNLASTYGGTATAQVQAFYQAISAGAGGVAEANALLDSANRLAIGGVTDVTTAVDVLTTAMNAYGPAVLSTQDASDSLFVAMKAGKTTVGEMGQTLGNVIPLAAEAGVSFDELTAGVAALTSQGQATSVAVTGLRAIIAAVLKPTSQAADEAERLGLEFNASALEAKGFEQFMQDVIEATDGSKDSMALLFGGVEALVPALALSGQAGEKFAQVLDDMENKAGATDEAFDKVAANLDQRLNSAMGKFNAAAVKLGNLALTVLVPAMELVAENLDRVTAYATAFAVVMGATMVPSLISAARGMAAFVLQARVLRGALISTGIGVVAIALGELYLWLERSTQSTGGLGVAFKALGDVAAAVWGYIVAAAASIPPSLNALWKDVEAGFFSMMESMSQNWQAFLASLANSIEGIPGLGGAFEKLASASNNAFEAMSRFNGKSQAAASAADVLRQKAESLRAEGLEGVTQAWETLISLFSTGPQTFDDNADATNKLTEAMNELEETGGIAEDTVKDLEDSLGGAGKAAKKAEEDVKSFADVVKSEAERAVDGFARAWGDLLTGGFDSFKDFASSIVSTFRNLISSLIAEAAKRQITLGLNLGTSGSLGSAAAGAAAGGAPGFGGILNSVLSFGGSVISGATGLITALTGAGGGLAAAGAYLSATLSTATSSLAAFGAAVGAVALPVAAVAAVFSFFKTKTKLLDSGLRITADSMGTLVEEFERVEKSRFWGLSKSRNTDYDPASAEVADPIIAAIDAIKSDFLTLGETMGLTADNFSSFSHELKLSLKGLSEQEAQQRILDGLNDFAESLAGAALGWFQEDLAMEIVRTGETWKDTLIALAGSLELVNGAMGELGFALFDASVAGAQVARNFADAFGGWEGFAQGLNNYVNSFYSDAEKLEIITARIKANLDGIDPNNVNTAMESRDLFKALTDWAGSGAAVDPQQANLFAKLINVAPLVDEMFKLQEAIDEAANSAGGGADGIESNSTARQQEISLLRQQYQLQGDVAALRALELDALDPANHELQQFVWGLQDAVEAADQSARELAELARQEREVADEKQRLLLEEMRLLGDVAGVRAYELEQLAPANRAIQERIWAISDQQAADEAAAKAANDAAEATRRYLEEQENIGRSLTRQILELEGDTAALRAMELAGLNDTNTALQLRVWALEDEKEAAEAARVAADNAAEAKRVADEAEARRLEDIASKRLALERQELEILGDTATIRALELEVLDASLRPLQERIWALLDAADAEAAAVAAFEAAERDRVAAEEEAARERDRILSERLSLERRELEVLGDTAALRALELEVLDPSNRALQERIWMLEDLAIEEAELARQAQAAADERARLDREAADRAQAVAQERYGLETRLLQLQGNTVELRRRELDLLDPTNRELQELIWALEDAEAGISDLSGTLREEMFTALGALESLVNRELTRIDAAARVQIDLLEAQIDQARAAIAATRASLDYAFDVTTASIDARRAILNAQFSASIDRMNQSLSNATDRAKAAADIFNLLDGALAGRRSPGAGAGARSFNSGRVSLAQAARGASPLSSDDLRAALEAVEGGGAEFYGTFADFAHDYNKTTADIAALAADAETQLTDAQRTVNALEAQIKSRELQHDAEMAALDKQLQEAQALYDLTTGQIVEIMSVGEALALLEEEAREHREVAEDQERLISVATAQLDEIDRNTAELKAPLEQILQRAQAQVSILNGTYNATLSVGSAVQNLENTMQNYLSSLDTDIASAIADQFAAAGVPGFASGGLFAGGARVVGETGPELEVTGPARYYSASQTASMLRGGGGTDRSSEILRELRDARTEQSFQLAKIRVAAEKSYDLERKWDKDGLPAERV